MGRGAGFTAVLGAKGRRSQALQDQEAQQIEELLDRQRNPHLYPIEKDERRVWTIDGKPNSSYHRIGGPAVEWRDGTKEWYENGERHRTDGPAIEHADGTRLWWLDGALHREDGPAVENADGTKVWWLSGEFFKSKELFDKALFKENP